VNVVRFLESHAQAVAEMGSTEGWESFDDVTAVAVHSRRRLAEKLFEASSAASIDLLAKEEGPRFYRRLPHRELHGFRLYPGRQ
jgi:hypothetical protein